MLNIECGALSVECSVWSVVCGVKSGRGRAPPREFPTREMLRIEGFSSTNAKISLANRQPPDETPSLVLQGDIQSIPVLPSEGLVGTITRAPVLGNAQGTGPVLRLSHSMGDLIWNDIQSKTFWQWSFLHSMIFNSLAIKFSTQHDLYE